MQVGAFTEKKKVLWDVIKPVVLNLSSGSL